MRIPYPIEIISAAKVEQLSPEQQLKKSQLAVLLSKAEEILNKMNHLLDAIDDNLKKNKEK